MKKLCHPLFLNLPIAVLLTAASLSWAQETEETEGPLWYQVELFIFANENSAVADTELWPEQLRLRYPENIVHLIDPSQLEEITDPLFDPLNSLSRTITFGENIEEPLATDGEEASQELAILEAATDEENTIAEEEAQTITNTIDTEGKITTAEGTPELETELITEPEQPFILLEDEQKQLTEAVARITAQRDFRSLFYQAWRQPMYGREESTNILILGGDKYDEHYELEGTINLSVERYLHINTDLWFSKFTTNTDTEALLWPVLPAIPTQVTPDILEEDITDNFTLFPEQVDQQNVISESNSFSQTSVFSEQDNVVNLFNNPFFNLVNQQFKVERTVAVRQSRRMRSTELHYIDHPLLGILVRITPYEFEQEESELELIEQDETILDDTNAVINN